MSPNALRHEAFRRVCYLGVSKSGQAELMDGKLLLVTNTRDLSPIDLVRRYKSLADIECGFRVLKSEIEIGPVHHRLPDRIRRMPQSASSHSFCTA
mgnify:CR=1 FL=1